MASNSKENIFLYIRFGRFIEGQRKTAGLTSVSILY